MGILDLILTPIYLAIIFGIALVIRNRTLAGSRVRKYFIPGLAVKIIGAISAGLIYQYYYGGGDTFFFYQGTKIIWQAFLDNPVTAFKILVSEAGLFNKNIFVYTNQIWTFKDPESFFVVRIAAALGFLCFNTYLVISMFLATISFIGTWALYKVFIDLYPTLHREMAIAILFLPSVFFWGSGLFKDTLTFAALGMLTYSLYQIFFKQTNIRFNGIIAVTV